MNTQNTATKKTLHDNAFTTIARTHATDGCSSTQGMAIGGDYIYSIQIKSDNSKCIMHRVHRMPENAV